MYYRDVRGSKWEILGSVSHRHNPICCVRECERALMCFTTERRTLLTHFRPLLLGLLSLGRTLSPLRGINFPFLSPLETGGRVNAAQEVHTHTHTHTTVRREHTHTRRAALRKARGFEKWERTRKDSDYSLGQVDDKHLSFFAYTFSERNLSLYVRALVCVCFHSHSRFLVLAHCQLLSLDMSQSVPACRRKHTHTCIKGKTLL